MPEPERRQVAQDDAFRQDYGKSLSQVSRQLAAFWTFNSKSAGTLNHLRPENLKAALDSPGDAGQIS